MNGANQVIIEQDVPCTVRDGVTLYANIYRPQATGAYPVLISRTPYNKNLPEFSHRYIDPIRLARSGYIVIIQDVRGRFTSEGYFHPFLQEKEDGFDTVEWAAQLPYVNGEVGMFGMSYYGFTQLYAAIERPPSLKAVFPAMTGNDLREGLVYRGGALELALFETWMLDSIAPNFLIRDQTGSSEQMLKEIHYDLDQVDHWYPYTPIENWPPLQKHPELAALFNKYVKNESSFLAESSYKEKLSDLDLPAYHLAGWYDCFLGPTLSNYMEMTKGNNPQGQKLIIGPWAHGMFDSIIGERSFGIQSSGDWIDGKGDLTAIHIRWFNERMQQGDVSVVEDDPVDIFVMGTNRWRSEKEWPLKRAEYTPFYLHSDGSASHESTSGVLNTIPPDKEHPDTFLYDPNYPVPTVGGGTLFYKGLNAGPRDQSSIEERGDVLTYTTVPMKEPLEVTGPIKVILWAASDAVDTDFTAKLVDVSPDGKAFNLTDGIIRAKYRRGNNESSPLTGEIIKYEIDLWATSNVFLSGHSIRIEISSSNFPRYDINPNTGETTIETTHMIKANQFIYHEKEYPSHVILPVIPT